MTDDTSEEELFSIMLNRNAKRHRMSSRTLSRGQENIKGTQPSGLCAKRDTLPVRKVIEITDDAQDSVTIKVQEAERFYELDISLDDSFQKIFNIGTNDTNTRIEYRNMTISKYITPRELECEKGSETFFIFRNRSAGGESHIYQLKINSDFWEDFVVSIDKNKTIKHLLKICADKSTAKKTLLVMNGILLSEKDVICDKLEDGDTLDYVLE